MRKIYLLITCGFLTFIFLSCPGQPGLLPFHITDDPTAKFQIHPFADPTTPTRVALYIDAERYTPLNALYYVLEDGTQFFDYVILGSLQLRTTERGVYIYIPPGLRGLLERHTAHIRPLREAGIKVLLGVRGGHAGVTFSTIRDQYLNTVFRELESIMLTNFLDGFEIWDIDGADTAIEWESDGSGFPYPSGTHRLADGTYHTVPFDEWANYYWDGEITGGGGGTLSDFILFLRSQLLGGPGGGGIVGGDIEQFIIISREENYGAWIAYDPPAGTFTLIWEHLNYSVNPHPASFGSPDGWGLANFPHEGNRLPGGSTLFHSDGEGNTRFGPLAIELHPANSRINSPEPPPTTVVPPITDENGNCIFNFSVKFHQGRLYADGQYIPRCECDPCECEYCECEGEGMWEYSQFGIIHYRGLRPASLASADDVLRITDEQFDALIEKMERKRDYLVAEYGVDYFPIVVERTADGQRLTQAGYMSITSLLVFGQPVIGRGGNHIKNW